MTKLQKLISISSQPLSHIAIAEQNMGKMFAEIRNLLQHRNGFSAFESALVVFPFVRYAEVPGISEWNTPKGWRNRYRTVIGDEYICFAHDLFGVQFAYSESGIVRLDPVCGLVSEYASSIEGWAERLLENYEEDTGWPLAHDWQRFNGTLSPGMRLLPKLPFVLGGDYVEENLVAVECHKAMEYIGNLYEAIRDVPDGHPITIKGWIC